MITLTKNGNAIVFTFSDNAHYLFDGTIEVPVNSLTLITDNSQMATFKKSASNDIFISATYAELGMSKSELESWFKENACGSTGGGGVTSGEVETMIETSLEDYYDIDEIDAALSAKANTATTYTKTEVDTALANKADTATTYTKTEVDNALGDKADTSAVTASIAAAVSGKQDTLIAGSGITISGNVISSEGGGVTVDPSLDSGSTNPVANSAITAAIDTKQDISKLPYYIYSNANGYGSNRYLAIAKRDRRTGADSTDLISFARINNKGLVKSDDVFSLVETSAITSSITSASTNAEVAGAKAVYDAIQAGGGGGVSESAFTSYSAATDARLSEDEEVTAAALNALNDGKQDTLIAGSGITISGNVISAEGGNLVIELTQAEYDALVDKDPDTFYVITDAEAIDISNYYTKTEVNTALASKADTSAVTESINSAVSGKVNTSAYNAYTAATDARISEDEDVTAAALNALNDRVDAIDITVDSALDATSENPVQNKVIYAVIGDIESLLSNI